MKKLILFAVLVILVAICVQTMGQPSYWIDPRSRTNDVNSSERIKGNLVVTGTVTAAAYYLADGTLITPTGTVSGVSQAALDSALAALGTRTTNYVDALGVALTNAISGLSGGSNTFSPAQFTNVAGIVSIKRGANVTNLQVNGQLQFFSGSNLQQYVEQDTLGTRFRSFVGNGDATEGIIWDLSNNTNKMTFHVPVVAQAGFYGDGSGLTNLIGGGTNTFGSSQFTNVGGVISLKRGARLTNAIINTQLQFFYNNALQNYFEQTSNIFRFISPIGNGDPEEGGTIFEISNNTNKFKVFIPIVANMGIESPGTISAASFQTTATNTAGSVSIGSTNGTNSITISGTQRTLSYTGSGAAGTNVVVDLSSSHIFYLPATNNINFIPTNMCVGQTVNIHLVNSGAGNWWIATNSLVRWGSNVVATSSASGYRDVVTFITGPYGTNVHAALSKGF
jgi:hypothetical protein